MPGPRRATEISTSVTALLLCDLTLWILNHNYIEFGDNTYQQIYGTAMGTPLAVVFANLFLQQLESIVFQQLQHAHPVLFKRYIDDIFAIFKNKLHAEQFIKVYNSTVDSIKITHSVSQSEGIFLDLVIYSSDTFPITGKLDVKLFQKPQNKYQYLPPFSFHNKAVYNSYIGAELNRICLNCSDATVYNANKELFRQRLIEREYTAESLCDVFSKPRNRQQLIDKIRNKTKNKQLNNMPLTFQTTFSQESQQFKHKLKQCLKLTSDILDDPHSKQIFNNTDPIICFKKSKSLGQMFTKSKYEFAIT